MLVQLKKSELVLSFYAWSGTILTNDEFEPVPLLAPLAGDQWSFAHILNRFTGPLDRPYNRLVVRCYNRLQNRGRFVQVLRPLQHIAAHLKHTVLKPCRLM